MSTKPVIAVIDDDDSFRFALIESLCSLGYDARGFASGEEFIVAENEEAWGCVISDVHMPGMSGFELRSRLAARHSKVPVIMITARAEPDVERRAAASGIVGLLRKPFESNALIGYLESALKV